eukprot:4701704-Pleurochrysis_carterae.AAC.3
MLTSTQRVKTIWCQNVPSRVARADATEKTTMYQKRKRAEKLRFVPVASSPFDAMMNSAHMRLRLKAAQRSEPAFPTIKALVTSSYCAASFGWLEPKA